MDFVFETEMMVRDYECDIQGIVNNAVYQNYLEHARHEYLHSVWINFTQLHDDGIDPVVIRIEMDYKVSLKPRDTFIVKVGVHRQGRLRFVFDQAIFRKADDKLVLEAQAYTVLTRNGRPIAPTLLGELFASKD